MSGRLRLPSPAMAVALAALVLAAGGIAVAAIPDSKGVIHACYAKNSGALRVVGGSKCANGEKSLSWSRGAGPITVRSKNVALHYTCQEFPYPGTPPPGYTPMYTCSANKSDVVMCRANERATGGGYGAIQNGGGAVTESLPAPSAGTPRGWRITAGAGAGGSSPAHSDAHIRIYVLCATA